jgi:hypothetical protein
MAPSATEGMPLHEWYKSVKDTDKSPMDTGPIHQQLEVATRPTEQDGKRKTEHV